MDTMHSPRATASRVNALCGTPKNDDVPCNPLCYMLTGRAPVMAQKVPIIYGTHNLGILDECPRLSKFEITVHLTSCGHYPVPWQARGSGGTERDHESHASRDGISRRPGIVQGCHELADQGNSLIRLSNRNCYYRDFHSKNDNAR